MNFVPLVPEDHILRRIDKYIDFSFINNLCRPYYCENNGRPGHREPEIMFKMLFYILNCIKHNPHNRDDRVEFHNHTFSHHNGQIRNHLHTRQNE